MDDLPPLDPDSASETESTRPPPTKVFLGLPTRAEPTHVVYRPYHSPREPDPPFWTHDWFKSLVFLLIASSAGGWAYYHFYWPNRLPQEHQLTDVQGKTMDVTILGHDDALLKYTLPGSATVRYLSLATLAPPDQEFIAKLSSKPVAQLPLYCTLTDSEGKETVVRIIARNENWVRCTLISDGSTHYIPLATLTDSDQAVIRLLPSDLFFNYPMDYVFTGSPRPGTSVQLLGRNDDTIEYLVLATGQKYFSTISQLSDIDQSFVREFPAFIPDRPPLAQDNGSNQVHDGSNSLADIPVPKSGANSGANSGSNGPINPNVLKALVIVKGDYSEGSGFIAKLHNQYFVVTNEHVLSGNKEFTITDMDGNKIPTNGALYGAVDYDVAIMKVPDSVGKHYLEILADPEGNTKVGDPVTVPGNSFGAEVPSQINGDLLAIGPQLVEVSAQLQHGISGSPIIDRTADKVIGIATMSITYRYDSASSGLTTETRWFGYRVDNINTDNGWVKIDWARFRDEGLKVQEAVDLYKSLDMVLRGRTNEDVPNDLVQSAINEFQSEVSSAQQRRSSEDVQSAIRAFNGKLRSLADNGTTALTSTTLYPYHAEIVKNLDDLRIYMDKAFDNTNRKFNNLVNSGL